MGGRLRQIAYAVDDVERAAGSFAATTGAGPFFVRHHPPMLAVDADGTAGWFRHTSAYGQWGDLQVELLRIDEPRRFGPAPPAVHHVARFAASLDADVERLAARGWPLLLRAETSSGLPFAFVDARADLGHLVELYEPAGALLALYDGVRRAAHGWNGTHPIRPLDTLPHPADTDDVRERGG